MKAKKETKNQRIPIKAHQSITLKDATIICDTCIGAGSTCLVYRGRIASGTSMIPDTEVIIKEFYPVLREHKYQIFRDTTSCKMSFCIGMEGNYTVKKNILQELAKDILNWDSESDEKIKEAYESELEHKLKQFLQGIRNQKRLSRSEAMEIAVKPWIEGWWGDSYYVVSDIHRGTDLSKAVLDTLEKKFLVAIGIAEMLDILHETGFLLLDLKPENLMWVEHPSMIRIMDVDSLIRFDEMEDDWKILFSNFQYASPELEVLNWKVQEGVSEEALRKIKKDYLQKDSNFYSLGVYLWELFFSDTYLKKDLQTRDKHLMVQQFAETYAALEVYEEKKLCGAGNALLEVLEKLLIENRTRRRKEGYKDAESIMRELNEIYTMLTSKKYLFRKEISKANGTFSAYHLLQNYPLFQYRISRYKGLKHQISQIQTEQYRQNYEDSLHRLEVVIIGKHAMRRDMLSAVISIGQMLGTQLHIYLVASDAASFWDDYLSEANNPGLKDAVCWSLDGHIVSDTFNPFLVNRPLAEIHLITKEISDAIDVFGKEKIGRYFIVLEENIRKKIEVCGLLYDIVRERSKHEKYLISYLQSQEGYVPDSESIMQNLLTANSINKFFIDRDFIDDIFIDGSPKIDFVSISSDSFSESYNEKMFENQIYNMGLMAYAYYNGYMKEDVENQTEDDLNNDTEKDIEEYVEWDMIELEKSFRKDIYGITSSERCALHSVYKIASLGIPSNKPGRFLNFYRKLQNDDILEKLAWLEHLSWTAYLLTSGAVPVFTKESDLTKENFKRLFECYAYLENNDWKDKRVSGHIRHPFLVAYYLDDYKKKDKGWLDANVKWSEEEIEQFDPLDKVSYRLTEWYRDIVKEIQNEESQKEKFQNKKFQYEKILLDAQKERDIKQSDRDLVFAAVDMIV